MKILDVVLSEELNRSWSRKLMNITVRLQSAKKVLDAY